MSGPTGERTAGARPDEHAESLGDSLRKASAMHLGFGTLYARRGGYRPQNVVQVEEAALQRVLARPPLREYTARLWQRRHFIVADARARVVAGTRANLLGAAWLVLTPILNGMVYFAVFGLLLRMSRGIPNFVGYLIIGVFMFQFTIRSLTSGATAITGGRSLIRSFSFPRAALPIATAMRELIRFLPVLAVMIVMIVMIPWIMPALNPGGTPIEPHFTWRWLLLPCVLALQLTMNLGLALIAARACAALPDLRQLIRMFTRFWLYTSAVFFSFERFADYPAVQSFMKVNPMFIVLDITRDCLLYGVTPAWTSWAILTAWAVPIAVIGYIWFWRAEESYGTA